MSESETVAKNRIEFQWGSKLQGTSLEALQNAGVNLIPQSVYTVMCAKKKKKKKKKKKCADTHTHWQLDHIDVTTNLKLYRL